MGKPHSPCVKTSRAPIPPPSYSGFQTLTTHQRLNARRNQVQNGSRFTTERRIPFELEASRCDSFVEWEYGLATICIGRSHNGGCGRHRPHRGLKVKSHIHCMGIGQLCKNIEGDPAKPGLAATTCWQTTMPPCPLNKLGLPNEQIEE